MALPAALQGMTITDTQGQSANQQTGSDAQQGSSLPESLQGMTITDTQNPEPSTWQKVKNFFTPEVNTTGEIQMDNGAGGNARTIIVPKPGESFEDTMKRAVQHGQQHPEEVQNSENASKDMGVGAAKSAGQTVKTLANIATLGGANKLINAIGGEGTSQKIDQELTASNKDQQAGQNVETILEYFGGDEALKALSMGEKLGQLSKVASFMEKYPSIANVLGNAIRGGVVGGTVGGIHGGTKGAVEGALGGAAVGGGVSALGDVGGVFSDIKDAVTPTEEEVAAAENARKFANPIEEGVSKQVGKFQAPSEPSVTQKGMIGYLKNQGLNYNETSGLFDDPVEPVEPQKPAALDVDKKGYDTLFGEGSHDKAVSTYEQKVDQYQVDKANYDNLKTMKDHIESLPPTERDAITQLIRQNTTASKVPFMKTTTDWHGVLDDFDNLAKDKSISSVGAQFERFSDPAAIRSTIRKQALIQTFTKSLSTKIGVGVLGALGAGAGLKELFKLL